MQDETGQRSAYPRKYGSDVMVDAMQIHRLEYATLNPGASFRGLHDSIVNYGGNSPKLLECPHEKIAVGLAHGYAKVTGQPMAVLLHNVVGLLQGTMGIFYAYLDRVPVLVFGGTGPMAYEKRRPNIDWIHTANVQGNAVRDYTKWDEQPATIDSVHEAVARGYRVAMSEPRGPVYLTLDAGLQEDLLKEDIPPLDVKRYRVPSRIGADEDSLKELAGRLVNAKRPLVVAGYAGRDPEAFSQLVDLAELLGMGVVDTSWRLNFPNRHPLNVTESDAIEEADTILFLDVKDMGAPTQRADSTTRTLATRISEEATILDLGFNDLEISSWAHDFAQLHPADVQVTADTVLALPQLISMCRELLTQEVDRSAERAQWRERLASIHAELWQSWRSEAERTWDQSPVSSGRLTAEVWEVIKEHDWVLTAGTAKRWALRTWDFDVSYRHPGRELGTATQIGISLGVALAHKGTGRLVVDLQPDGDLMFDPGALWVAAYYEIPMLVVMVNNRAYYNDWEHQERMAHDRGTDLSLAYLGMELDHPAPDFAALAASFGWRSEGPISDPDSVQGAVRRAADYVVESGLPALVDVVCQYR